MKHVAIFAPQFPVLTETFVLTEIDALIQEGHKVTVITLRKHPCHEDKRYAVCTLSRGAVGLAIRGLFSARLSRLFRGWQVASEQHAITTVSLFYFSLQVNQLVKTLSIDHIHCHFMHSTLAYGVVAAHIAGIGVSSVGHGHDVYVEPQDLMTKLKFSDFNIAVCEDMLKVLRHMKSHSIHLLHCGVDLDKFQPREDPANPYLKLVFIGRLVEKKGVKYALKALADIPRNLRPTIDIIGAGPEFENLQSMTQTLKLEQSVTFLGPLLPKEIAIKLGDYDALIAPFCVASNGDKDTGPLVLKEAMASGLPVITTNIMGCPEIINSQCGYMVPSRDSSALKNVILEFIALPRAEKKQMRIAAFKRAKTHFNALTQGLKLSKLIEQVEHEH